MRLLWHAMLVGVLIFGESTAVPALAQPQAAPAYARQRAGVRGGGGYSGGYRADGYGYHRGARYGYYPYQPAIAGSWYTRPYPHHFDYYRWRYYAAPPAASDCPCANTTQE